MPLLLSCESISKAYGSRTLFQGLSIAISDGERLGLIGPNGSGKSTLIEILAGVKEADSGTVSARKLTRVGYVPQDSVFPPDQTARGVLEAMGASDAVIAETLGRAGFADGDIPAGALSGGWKKRLAIAAELVQIAGCAAAGRAHEPPGPRGHPVARRAAEARALRVRRRQPRPLFSRKRGDRAWSS